jgi:SSS family transporter
MNPIDLAVIVAYVVGCTALGAWLGAEVKGLKGYFLGESNIPAWAVMISIVATETSTATFLSVPAVAFRPGGDFAYLQLAFGYLLGRVVVSALLLPAYFKGEIFTAYHVLNQRFGGATKTTASVLFLVARTLGDGLRLFLAGLVLGEITGWPLSYAILAMGVATIVYTYLGGMRAVIWTDVIQFFIYILGALVALAILVGQISGGWPALIEAGRAAGKFRLFNFDRNLSEQYTFWAGLIGGMFLNTATHGADQLMVQRYLSARSQRQAAGALIASGFVVLAQFALFLLIGVGLSVLYRGTDQAAIRPDRAFTYFIVHNLPTGILGLVIAAIFSAAMSTLSGSLNASASSAVNDLYRPLAPGADERHLLRLSKILTAVWGLAQMGVALAAIPLKNLTVVESALAIASFVTGILLGLFLLGILTRRVGQGAALCGLVAGLLAVSYVRFGPELPEALYPWKAAIAWPWFALIGSMTVFLVGLLASLALPESRVVPIERQSEVPAS